MPNVLLPIISIIRLYGRLDNFNKQTVIAVIIMIHGLLYIENTASSTLLGVCFEKKGMSEYINNWKA